MDQAEKVKGLGLDLTHRCNLNCSFCWKYINDSDYEMTIDQVKRFCYYLGYLKSRKLRITGGEPLMHPEFIYIISLLMNTFDSIMQVTTNGLLLDETYFHPRIQYVVTPYAQNKEIIERFKNKIIIYPRPRGYFDRHHDPNLTTSQAKQIYKKCVYKQIRVIGDNIYDCCHAETLERLDRTESVHVKVGPNWQAEFNKMDNWKECIHCFVGDGGIKWKYQS